MRSHIKWAELLDTSANSFSLDEYRREVAECQREAMEAMRQRCASICADGNSKILIEAVDIDEMLKEAKTDE